MTLIREIPSTHDLTHSQYKGWACVWCGVILGGSTGATLVGRATGWSGAHDLSCDAYACDKCKAAAIR